MSDDAEKLPLEPKPEEPEAEKPSEPEKEIVNLTCRRDQFRGGPCGSMTHEVVRLPRSGFFYQCTKCGNRYQSVPTGGHFPY